MTEGFTPWTSLAGGALIGLATSVMLLGTGRIAGISGIVGGLLTPRPGDVAWRGAFLAGMIVAGVLASIAAPEAFASTLDRSPAALAIAGVLVGFGTRLGNGCTSGHGVCGVSRAAPRSIVATLTFMTTGAVAATVVQNLLGGRL